MTLELGITGLNGLATVGRGGSGTVYHALGSEGEDLAVKIFTGVWDETQQRRFERELEAMEILKNVEGVVPLLQHGTTSSGAAYLVMPFHEKGSLQKVVDEQGSLEQSYAVGLVAKVAEVLADTHDFDVFHRDLKPGNILLADDGGPVVADFGVTQISDGRSLSTTTAYTPGFCPPEALSKGRSKVDGAGIDVYGLGATLWSLLTRRTPFTQPGEDRLDTVVLLNRIATEQLATVPDIDDWVNTVIAKATAKEAASRYSSMRAFLDDLRSGGEAALSERQETQNPTVVRNDSPPGNLNEPVTDVQVTGVSYLTKHRVPLTVAAIATALLLGIGGTLLARSSSKLAAKNGTGGQEVAGPETTQETGDTFVEDSEPQELETTTSQTFVEDSEPLTSQEVTSPQTFVEDSESEQPEAKLPATTTVPVRSPRIVVTKGNQYRTDFSFGVTFYDFTPFSTIYFTCVTDDGFSVGKENNIRADSEGNANWPASFVNEEPRCSGAGQINTDGDGPWNHYVLADDILEGRKVTIKSNISTW